MTHQEIFILALAMVGVVWWIMAMHAATTREMLRLLERQIVCLERMAEPDDDDPEREPAPVLQFRKPG